MEWHRRRLRALLIQKDTKLDCEVRAESNGLRALLIQKDTKPDRIAESD